ncbi:hypothetical protein D7D25_11500 [Proteiniphilum sp. X52]|nr:hypothetical protein D7D25_11500 [Proteiniphilum sp. X52]
MYATKLQPYHAGARYRTGLFSFAFFYSVIVMGESRIHLSFEAAGTGQAKRMGTSEENANNILNIIVIIGNELGYFIGYRHIDPLTHFYYFCTHISGQDIRTRLKNKFVYAIYHLETTRNNSNPTKVCGKSTGLFSS